MRLAAAVLLGICCLTRPALGQDPSHVQRARSAYTNLDYETAISEANAALRAGRLPRADLVSAYEILGYSYAVLDSSTKAVNAFSELIQLDPDREPDVVKVSPRITSLYATALGSVLVVRHVRADSARFVAGTGSLPIHFQVSRAALVVTRIVGNGLDLQVDSELVAGPGTTAWRGTAGDTVAPNGHYDIIIAALSSRDRFDARFGIRVRQEPVDTLPFVTSLPGYAPQPEFETPQRDWSPFRRAALFTAVGAGIALAAQSSQLGRQAPRQLLVVSAGALVAGAVASFQRPAPRPVPAAVLYNRLLRDQIARRNAEIAQENAQRRKQTMLVVTPEAQ